MTKELTTEILIQIKQQIDKIFISHEISINDKMSILLADIMQCIRIQTFNNSNSNLEEAKFIYETMKNAFKATK